jgi:hypothetical protein
MILRRISTKWVLRGTRCRAAAFLGFAWFVDPRIVRRHWDTVRDYLYPRGRDRGSTRRGSRSARHRLVWTDATPLAEWTVNRAGGELVSLDARGRCNHSSRPATAYDLIHLVNSKGERVVWNTRDVDGVG